MTWAVNSVVLENWVPWSRLHGFSLEIAFAAVQCIDSWLHYLWRKNPNPVKGKMLPESSDNLILWSLLGDWLAKLFLGFFSPSIIACMDWFLDLFSIVKKFQIQWTYFSLWCLLSKENLLELIVNVIVKETTYDHFYLDSVWIFVSNYL